MKRSCSSGVQTRRDRPRPPPSSASFASYSISRSCAAASYQVASSDPSAKHLNTASSGVLKLQRCRSPDTAGASPFTHSEGQTVSGKRIPMS